MKQPKHDLCIIGGAGHIGLPLAITFAEKGLNVVIFDIDKKALKTINKGKMPFMEEGAEPILKKVINKKLTTSDSPKTISESKFVISTIGTSFNKHSGSELVLIEKAINKYYPYFKNGQILIMRSTVFPGTSEKIQKYFSKKGKRVFIAFCPERIAEGKAIKELNKLPQIISGFNKEAILKVKELFLLLTDKIIEVKPVEAELAKLCTNAWRYINFATANQFLLLAMKNNVNFENLYKAITQEYPRAKNLPTPGFTAGPCLLKDTCLLNTYDSGSFLLGNPAIQINESLPKKIIEKLKEKINISDKNTGILGMAFKAENDDPRESLSYELKKILEIECKNVFCSDEYIKNKKFVSVEKLIKNSDIIIIGVPHKKYASINKNLFRGKIVIDIWNVINLKEKFL